MSLLVTGPKPYIYALYKDVPGAVATNNVDGNGGYGYIVPCDMKLNVSFAFGYVFSTAHIFP